MLSRHIAKFQSSNDKCPRRKGKGTRRVRREARASPLRATSLEAEKLGRRKAILNYEF